MSALSSPAPADSQNMRPSFTADDIALDLVNARYDALGAPYDWLASGDRFAAWVTAADSPALTPLIGQSPQDHPKAWNTAARQTQKLRQAFLTLLETAKAGAPDPDSLAQINAVLAKTPLYRHLSLDPDTGGFGTGPDHTIATPSDIAGFFALHIADLLKTAQLDHIRLCQGTGCPMWFHDQSKSRRRRWCSMSLCGNRAKVRKHRAQAQDQSK